MSLSPSDDNVPDINNTNEALAVSIAESIKNSDKETLQQLLENCKKASLPLPVIDRRSPPALHLAASESQYKECLELLLKYCDNKLFGINDEWEGMTALHVACMNGCYENILPLIQSGCDPYKVTSKSKQSALHIAIMNCNSKIVGYLLDHYHDNINQRDSEGRTPLYRALDFHFLEIAYMLLEKEANVSSVDLEGTSILHLICRQKTFNFDMLPHLTVFDLTTINYQNSEGITPFMLAAANSDTRGARFLHEHGAETGICDTEGRLALHYAATSGNTELLQFVLEHTEMNSIEQCFMNIPNVFQAKNVVHSLIGGAIDSRNIECLEILLSSDKLSKGILQTPLIIRGTCNLVIYSPIAHVLNRVDIKGEKLITSLQLLLKHKVKTLDEFSNVLKIKWPCHNIEFQHPFSKIFNYNWRFSEQQYYFHLLNENDITIDYCLQCYHDNKQPFTTFTDYKKYYEPVMMAICQNKIEAVKLMLSNSAILEPDELLIQFNAASNEQKLWLHQHQQILWFYKTEKSEETRENVYKYLISLKPIYYRQVQLCNEEGQEPSWYPYSTISEEFSTSTLQQLCRTTIRHHIRKYTLEENLRDFRRNILELPGLPPILKNYLLFKN